MATCWEQLSLWGKEAYLDISGKMLASGIRLNGGVLAPNGFLGRWLIKEIDLKESDLNVAIRPDYMVFVQPGGKESNTWKLIWLTKEPSANPSQGSPYTHHSISNFPGPELMVNPQNGKRQVVYICL